MWTVLTNQLVLWSDRLWTIFLMSLGVRIILINGTEVACNCTFFVFQIRIMWYILFKLRFVNTFYLLEKTLRTFQHEAIWVGYHDCVSKQRISCVRFLCKLIRMDETRTVSKIWRWASRRRTGWNHEVNKTVQILNIQNEVNDLTFSTKFILKTAEEKIDVRDQEEWYDEAVLYFVFVFVL